MIENGFFDDVKDKSYDELIDIALKANDNDLLITAIYAKKRKYKLIERKTETTYTAIDELGEEIPIFDADTEEEKEAARSRRQQYLDEKQDRAFYKRGVNQQIPKTKGGIAAMADIGGSSK